MLQLNMDMNQLTRLHAFQKMHGINPSEARDKGVQLKAFPKISFQISIKGDTEMEAWHTPSFQVCHHSL